MTLADLAPGERAVVVGWGEAGCPTRVLEMGVLEGTELRVVRRAPLGDPIDVLVRGYHLSLRDSEAKTIVVEKIG